MEKKKDILVEAYARKARACADMGDFSGFDACLKELKKWIDIDQDKKFSVLTIEREKRAGRHGSALKYLTSLLKTKGEDTKGGIRPFSEADLLAERAKIFKHLEYTELVEHDKKRRLISAPKDFSLF
jgi:DNA-binding SARP family transcriptional activator